MPKDYYGTLGVKPGASQKEIQKAFHAMALKYHPDVSDDLDAEARFKEINEAYQILSQQAQPAEHGHYQYQQASVEEHVYFYLMGYDKYIAKDYRGAIDDFTEAIRLYPRYALAYYQRARSYDHLKQYGRAIEDFDRAIELDPHIPYAYENRAAAKQKAGDFKGALADATSAIEVGVFTDFSYQTRGNANTDLGNYDDALADHNRAIERRPNASYHYSNRGLVYSRLHQYDLSTEDYDRALELDPNNATAYMNRGIDLRELGRYEEALADLSSAMRLEPDNPLIPNNRGSVYLKFKDYAAAQADYDMALRLKPDYALAHFNLALVKLLMKEFGEALAGFRHAEFLMTGGAYSLVPAGANEVAPPKPPHYRTIRSNVAATLSLVMALAYQGLGDLETAQRIWREKLLSVDERYMDFEWVKTEHDLEDGNQDGVRQLIASLGG